MSKLITYDQEQPTVIALCPQTGNFILGDAAKKLREQSKTGIVNFKALSGKSPTEVKKAYDLWYLDANDDAHTLTLEKALQTYFTLLFPTDEIPREVFVGVPSAAVNDEWIRRYKSNVIEGLKAVGAPDVKFVTEPVAVFEYYRSEKKLDDQKRYVVVMDVGGSTFNCCLLEQRGKGEEVKVHALDTAFFGGTDVDEQIFFTAIQDDPNADKSLNQGEFFSKNSKAVSLLRGDLERAKIQLSKNMRNGKEGDTEITVTEGLASPAELRLKITQAHLAASVERCWNKQWHKTVNTVIEDAQSRLKKDHISIGAILLAGGSSRLPNMTAWAKKSLTNHITTKVLTPNVKNLEKSVAHGISAHCQKIARAQKGHKTESVGEFFTGELFIAFRESYSEPWTPPTIGKGKDGQLLSGGSMPKDRLIEREITLPFKPANNFQIGLFSENPGENPDSQVNVGSDVFRVKAQGLLKNASLLLELGDDGQITVDCGLKSKKRNADDPSFCIGPLRIDGIDFVTGIEYVGLDFGHSNTYLTRILSEVANDSGVIPEFEIQRRIRNDLNKVYKKIDELRSLGCLSAEIACDYARRNVAEICYQSGKLEKLETPAPEDSEAHGENFETDRLSVVYESALDPNDACYFEHIVDSPLAYALRVHKSFGDGWIRRAGDFRDQGVKPGAGAIEYIAPALIEAELRALSDSLRDEREFARDPIFAACKFHVAFEMIHPFLDGNGRIGRLLMDAILLSSDLPPVILTSDRRGEYLDALTEANHGDISSFVTLVIEQIEQRLEEIRAEHKAPETPRALIPAGQGSTFLDRKRRGEDPLSELLVEVQEKEQDRVARFYDLHVANLMSVETCLEGLVSQINNSGEGMGSHTFSVTQVDTLTQESFKRFVTGNKEVSFRFKKIEHSTRSPITGRMEKVVFFFVCEGSETDDGLSLHLRMVDKATGKLGEPANTHIAIRTINLSGEPAQGSTVDGRECSLEEGVEDFLFGAIMDHHHSSGDRNTGL